MVEEKIPVRISKGMFSDECAVELTVASGKVVSFFVDCKAIISDGENNYLPIHVVRKHAHEWEVELPSEAFETQSRWATVSPAF